MNNYRTPSPAALASGGRAAQAAPLVAGGLALALGLAAPSAAQEQGPPTTPVAAAAPTAAERKPPAWPPLPPGGEDRIKAACEILRRMSKPETVAVAEARLLALGPAAVPFLIERLSDYRTNINEPLVRVLGQLTTEEHAPLLARSASDPRAAVRLFVIRRLTDFHRRDLAPVFRAARADRDPDIAFQAALGLLSAGDLAAMDEVFDRCLADWHGLREVVIPALRGVRGEAGTHWLAKRMRDSNDKVQTTALRLMRTVGDAAAAALVAPYLDAELHTVKKEAINTLRVIVDGDPPLDDLSVFQAIEMANAWKKRLQCGD